MSYHCIIGSFDFGASNSRLFLRKHIEGGIVSPDAVFFASRNTTRYIGRKGYLCEDADTALEDLLKQVRDKVTPNERKKIKAFSISAHGSSNFICLDSKGKAVFGVPSYDHTISKKDHELFYKTFGNPDTLYLKTGTHNQPNALNWAKLLFHQKIHHPNEWKKVSYIVPLNVYIGSRLCGLTGVASEQTQMHNHGYGEDNDKNLSSVIEDMGIKPLFPPVKRAYDSLGQINSEIAKKYGFQENCIVAVGGHDSSIFAMIPKLLGINNAVSVSTGTWDVIMAEREVALEKRLQKMGVLYNASIEGTLLRTVLFRGGSMRSAYLKQYGSTQLDVRFDEDVLENILNGNDIIKPAYMDNNGPYPNSNYRQKIPSSFKNNDIKFHHALAMSLAIQRALAIEIAGKTKLPYRLSIREFRNSKKETVVVGGPLVENYKENGKDSGKLTVSMETLRRSAMGKVYRLNFPEPTSLAAHILGVCALEGIQPKHLKKERMGFGVEDVTFTGDRTTVDRYIDVFEEKLAKQD